MNGAGGEAEKILEEHGFSGLPISVRDVCAAVSTEGCKVTIERKDLGPDAFQGMAVGDRGGAAIIVNSSTRNYQRKRFTAAHELGHVCLHVLPEKQARFECSERDIFPGGGGSGLYEREANAFAASLLMPSAAVSGIIRRESLSWAMVHSIRRQCDVSLVAAARRAVALSDEPCCLIVHQNGRMWMPVKSGKFGLYVPRRKFPGGLHAKPDGNGTPSLAKMDECDFGDWSMSRGGHDGALLYSTVHSAEFDRRMTLLLLR